MTGKEVDPPQVRLERSFETTEMLLHAFASPSQRAIALIHLARARTCAEQAVLGRDVPKIPVPAVRRASAV